MIWLFVYLPGLCTRLFPFLDIIVFIYFRISAQSLYLFMLETSMRHLNSVLPRTLPSYPFIMTRDMHASMA